MENNSTQRLKIANNDKMKRMYGAKAWEYVCDREQYLNSIGIFRCMEGNECQEICVKCREYYRK